MLSLTTHSECLQDRMKTSQSTEKLIKKKLFIETVRNREIFSFIVFTKYRVEHSGTIIFS